MICFQKEKKYVIHLAEWRSQIVSRRLMYLVEQPPHCDHLGDDLRCHLKVIHAAGKMLNKLKPTDGEKITQDHVSSQEGGQGWQV